MIELILIILLIIWVSGGLFLPMAGSLLNIILVIVVIYLILKVAGKV